MNEEHRLERADDLGTQALYLREGRIVNFGPVGDVVSMFKRDIAAASS